LEVVIEAILGISIDGHMTAGDLIVGGGTLALACVTWWLAHRTGQEVELTEEGLRLTRESIEAQDRPWVIATPNEHHKLLGFVDIGMVSMDPHEPEFRFAYRLWNVGKGPAVVYYVTLCDEAGNQLLGEEQMIERPVATTAVGRDELASIRGDMPGQGAELALTIRYRSGSGAEYETRSKVTVQDGGYCLCRDFSRVSI
jgi:hypothetical protein